MVEQGSYRRAIELAEEQPVIILERRPLPGTPGWVVATISAHLLEGGKSYIKMLRTDQEMTADASIQVALEEAARFEAEYIGVNEGD